MEVMWVALRGLGKFIYDFQTLLGVFAAILAAYIAARPVWRQLKLTQTQADGVLRDMLLKREVEIDKAVAAISEHVGKPLSDLSRTTYGLSDEPIDLSEEGAHHSEQTVSGAVRWLRLDPSERDSAAVETAKRELVEELDKLTDILGHIHTPASQQQHDEDHSFTDEQWAAIEARGQAAKGEVPDALSAAQRALRAVFQAVASERAKLKQRLKKLNAALIDDA
jgi:hypothetical protein